ncbi:replication-associated protein [Avon-Heathcote Estuary associated circular virus 4]|uniref:Replication-associated protein n=1 Tax=Avon-Heathcote Estuary associated circular virus 4 TaxID=1618255 RepID=A0A0C5IAW1_9VIRU|nr:replication-associated protein [Avon-Heathcote Estuary associated circular virus 4]AJP36347.1 replication-associated protein [Avon-Heathcote Estuary associated circular virus 4]AJP36350.1 replication-associated protein [Avon-Heathcote Estuary associated circular virus 4]AJP36351.1 replication-associated protein [Avon-Heathcote Estuary associated circular virus 4]
MTHIYKMADVRKRAYCMTIHNWSEETVNQLKNLKYQYLIIGNETCPTTDRKHLQVYAYFKNALSFKSIKKQFPTAHIEASKGTPNHNKTYCSKEDVLFEEGTFPEQGKRSDIEVCREIVQSGAGMREVVNHCQSVQGMRIAESYLKYHEKPRKWKPTVQWFYGESRSGKTREAYEILGDDCYTCLNTGKWFEGYDAHENVLIDDIRKSFMPYDEFIKLIDRYAFRRRMLRKFPPVFSKKDNYHLLLSPRRCLEKQGRY